MSSAPPDTAADLGPVADLAAAGARGRLAVTTPTWLSFADLMRELALWDEVLKNLGLQGVYAAVFGSAAWARFTAKDITA